MVFYSGVCEFLFRNEAYVQIIARAFVASMHIDCVVKGLGALVFKNLVAFFAVLSQLISSCSSL